ncbi:MAG: tetratricopeptide repeat protein [Syntrophobacteraceae bacterium]
MRYRIFCRTLILSGLILLLMLVPGCPSQAAPVSPAAARQYADGLRLFKAGRYAEAQKHAFNAWSAAPSSALYRSLLAWTNLKLGNTAEAEKLFNSIYRHDHNNLAALQGLAWVKYTLGQYPEAGQLFEKQLQRAEQLRRLPGFAKFSAEDKSFVISNLSDANYGRGLTALAQKDLTGAKARFEQALQYPNDFVGHAPITAALGDIYYLYRRDYSKAIGYYAASLREKADPLVMAKIAWCTYYEGQVGKANELFRKGLATQTDKRPFLYGLVFTSQALKKSSESKKYLEKLIDVDPYFADTGYVHQLIEKEQGWKPLYKDFATAYMKIGAFARAREILKEYLLMAKTDRQALAMVAWCDVYLNLKTALKEFDQLSSQNGRGETDVLLGKGVTLFYLGRLDEAGAILKEVLAKDPGNVRATMALGAIAFMKKDYRQAISIYTANISRLPKKEFFFSWPSWALNNLGWSYIYTGNYEKALQAFKLLQAYHPVPYYAAVSDGLGWAYLHLGRKAQAEKQFRLSVSLWPKDPAAKEGLSRLSRT